MVDELVGNLVFALLDLLISMLPLSPFLSVSLDGVPPDGLGWLNWCVDVGGMLDLMGLWLVAVLAYYVLKHVLDAFESVEGAAGAAGSSVLGWLSSAKSFVSGLVSAVFGS